jgi:hypothetical protein
MDDEDDGVEAFLFFVSIFLLLGKIHLQANALADLSLALQCFRNRFLFLPFLTFNPYSPAVE